MSSGLQETRTSSLTWTTRYLWLMMIIGSSSPSLLRLNQNVELTLFRYLKWAGVPTSQYDYLSNTCNDNRNSDNDSPTIVGEFSLSVPDDVQWTPDWDPSTQQAFYRQWFAAQVTKYEQDTNGWVFWTWKSQLGDYRWSYQDAVAAGVIPGNVADVDQGACNGY